MPFITSQPSSREDVPASVLEANAIAVTLANEWENEWNQSGLASRLSKEVGVLSFKQLGPDSGKTSDWSQKSN